MRRHLRASLAAVTLAGLLSVVPTGVSAQDSTASIPGAEDCTVEPRTEEEILAIVASATPVTGDNYDERQARALAEWDGVEIVGPADFETQEAIRDTVWQMFACGNADMPLHSYALVTDDLIANNEPTVEELRGQDPTDEIVDGEVVERGPIAVVDVIYVQMLSNGKVEAVVVADTPESPGPFEAYAFIFENVDGRWLLDGAAF